MLQAKSKPFYFSQATEICYLQLRDALLSRLFQTYYLVHQETHVELS